MKKAFLCGILASFFFAFTFLLNSSMNLSGGYWMWSACLRYFITLPLMVPLVWKTVPENGIRQVLNEIKKNLVLWFLWSTVGFGFFYLPLTMASIYGASWMVAASWQITIVAGILLTPLFGKRIPLKNLCMAFVILAGIFLLQIPNFSSGAGKETGIALLLIIIGAFSYPLGNRKMMEHCPSVLNTFQRVFGMTLCSMPFWIVTAVTAFVKSGFPGKSQLIQSAGVALFSGVIATVLFFYATDLVKKNEKQLAVVEATQSGEVVFTLLGGILVLGEAVPGPVGAVGLVLIIGGMIFNSIL